MRIAQAKIDNSWYKQNQLSFIIDNGERCTQMLWNIYEGRTSADYRGQFIIHPNTILIYKESL